MYDCIIIGAGPAGLSAGIYSARASMSTLIIEKANYGGLIAKTNEIANYPGVDNIPTGPELIEKMVNQAKFFGAEFVRDTVISLENKDNFKRVVCENKIYDAKSVIVATGSNPRLLNIEGEAEFTGKGVGYCATCDAPFFEGLDVYVVGSGEAAVEEAIYLTKFARTVTVLARKDKLNVAKSIEEKAFSNEKLKFVWNTEVEKFEGNMMLQRMTLFNNKTGEKTLATPREGDMVFGVFIFIGYLPQNEIFKDIIETKNGYAVTDESMGTNVEGIFVAGDVRDKNLRQVVTAVNDGAIAAISAGKYVESLSI